MFYDTKVLLAGLRLPTFKCFVIKDTRTTKIKIRKRILFLWIIFFVQVIPLKQKIVITRFICGISLWLVLEYYSICWGQYVPVYRVNIDVPPSNILNHSHRNIIPCNPSYGIFFINVLSLRKLDSLRTTAMEYFLYSGSSCKDKQTLPCTIFLYHRKTSYTYLPAKERCIMIHQKLHIRTIFILVPRTQFNVTVLMACIPCMWFHL